jgi:hypothetical protein
MEVSAKPGKSTGVAQKYPSNRRRWPISAGRQRGSRCPKISVAEGKYVRSITKGNRAKLHSLPSSARRRFRLFATPSRSPADTVCVPDADSGGFRSIRGKRKLRTWPRFVGGRDGFKPGDEILSGRSTTSLHRRYQWVYTATSAKLKRKFRVANEQWTSRSISTRA